MNKHCIFIFCSILTFFSSNALAYNPFGCTPDTAHCINLTGFLSGKGQAIKIVARTRGRTGGRETSTFFDCVGNGDLPALKKRNLAHNPTEGTLTVSVCRSFKSSDCKAVHTINVSFNRWGNSIVSVPDKSSVDVGAYANAYPGCKPFDFNAFLNPSPNNRWWV